MTTYETLSLKLKMSISPELLTTEFLEIILNISRAP